MQTTWRDDDLYGNYAQKITLNIPILS